MDFGCIKQVEVVLAVFEDRLDDVRLRHKRSFLERVFSAKIGLDSIIRQDMVKHPVKNRTNAKSCRLLAEQISEPKALSLLTGSPRLPSKMSHLYHPEFSTNLIYEGNVFTLFCQL